VPVAELGSYCRNLETYMHITHNFTVICDDVRMEIGAKFILIGVYANGLSTPQLPLVLPSLTVFQSFSADEVGVSRKFKATLRQLDNGAVLFAVEGNIQSAIDAPIVMPMRLSNLRFMSFGTYTWSFEVEGQEPFLTQFPLTHNPNSMPKGVRVMNPMQRGG